MEIGDKVQINKAQAGVVVKVRGDIVIVELEDGSRQPFMIDDPNLEMANPQS